MLAIIWALEEWQHFLEGTPCQFEIWTDHKNLEYFCTSKKLNQRQARWSLHLSQFDFTLHHHPRSSMGKSNALSWHSDQGSGSRDNADITLLRPSLFAIRALEGVTAIRVEVGLLWDIQREFQHGEKEESVVKAVEELQKGHSKSVRAAEWSKLDSLLHFQGKIYVPGSPELQCQIMSQHHDTRVAGHAGQWKTLELVARNYWWPQMSHHICQ